MIFVTMNQRSRALGVLLAGLALAGCAAPQDATAPAADKPDTTTPSATATSSSAAPTTSTPAPPPAPKAADGRRYAVCAKRSCEVAVRKPVTIRFGGSAPGTLKVRKVRADEVRMAIDLAGGGGGEGTIKPGCGTFVFRPYGGGTGTLGGPEQQCVKDKPAAEPGAVSVQVPELAGGVAVLRIVTG